MKRYLLVYKSFMLVIGCLLVFPFAKAQPAMVENTITNDPILLIVLPINEKKMDVLEKSLANEKLSERKRTRVQELLDVEKEQIKLRRARLAEAMTNLFSEQEYLFVHPQSIKPFVQSGVIDSIIDPLTGNSEEGLNLNNKNIVIGSFGNSVEGEQLVDVFVLRDRNYKVIENTSIRHPHISNELNLWDPEGRYKGLVKRLKRQMHYLAEK